MICVSTHTQQRTLMGNKTDTPKTVNRHLLHITKELVYALIGGIIISVVCQAFFFKPFVIPSASMEPTLLVGDTVIVNRQTYNLKPISRGDVIVFEDENDWMENDGSNKRLGFIEFVTSNIGLTQTLYKDYFTKRVIGLPGDVVYSGPKGRIYINGKVLNEEYLAPGVIPANTHFNVVVPKDKLWVMGDNRSISADSLYYSSHHKDGFISIDSVVGKVVFVSPSL